MVPLDDAEHDGFEVKEVFTGPEDCQIILTFDRTRFVVVIIRPDSRKDDDFLGSLFQQIDEAEEDPDEMAYHRCLEAVGDWAISTCKATMRELAASAEKLDGTIQSLKDFLYPTTFYLQLLSVDGQVEATTIAHTENYSSMHEPVCLSMDYVPPSAPRCIPALRLDFLDELFMGQVIKVADNGEVCVFKSASYGNEGQLKREMYMLHQVSERWGPGHDRLRIPRLLGLVTSGNEIAGILEEYIDGENLSELDLADICTDQRRKWKVQIEATVSRLHENGLVWGDVKPDNVIIDRSADAWLIDFGGSWTDGWVDEDVKETVEGDMQGLRRIVEFLGL